MVYRRLRVESRGDRYRNAPLLLPACSTHTFHQSFDALYLLPLLFMFAGFIIILARDPKHNFFLRTMPTQNVKHKDDRYALVANDKIYIDFRQVATLVKLGVLAAL